MSFVSPTEWFFPWPTTATIDAVIADLRKDQTKGVLLKFANGGKAFTAANFPGYGYDPKTVHIILDKFRAADIKVYGWVYLYAANPDELAAAKAALAFKLDGLVIDVESEFAADKLGVVAWGNREQRLRKYLAALRPLTPSLGWAPFWYPQGHAGDDYAIFAEYCDTAFPQVYWVLAKMTVTNMTSAFVKDWTAAEKSWPKKPAMVWTGDPGPHSTAAEVELFAKTAKAHGAGVSWWRVGTFGAGAHEAFHAMTPTGALAAPPQPIPVPAKPPVPAPPAPKPVPVPVTPAPDPKAILKAQLDKDTATIAAQAATIASLKTSLADSNAKLLTAQGQLSDLQKKLDASASAVAEDSAIRNFILGILRALHLAK